VRGREPIGVFGDYDVDGVTTAALLTTFLRACGATVHVRIARRDAGYGFGVADAEAFAGAGCPVVITGDCGTSDHDAVAAARARGIDVIIVDHHQVPEGETAAHALINPHQPGCGFAFKGLCSAGVGFYLAAALRTRLRGEGHFSGREPDPREWLDLVAIGTVADLAPLCEENRILVAAGLRVLAQRRRPGLAVLMERAQMTRVPSAFDVGFRIGPRLNAPGRMGDAEPALRLLLAEDYAHATAAADECEAKNAARQEIQQRVLEEAIAAVEAGQGGQAALLVAGRDWHPGVVGIVAAKLVERYGRPAAVLAGDGKGAYRGSVRSVPGFHAQRTLVAVSDHLVRYGGHEGAAGLTVQAERLDALRDAWESAAREALAGGAAPRQLAVDAEVGLDSIDERVATEIERLGPFGVGNPEPVLAAHVRTERTRVVGEHHLQLTLAGGRQAIAFRMAGRDPGGGANVRLAFVPEIDEFRGQRRLRLRVRDFAAAT
jgi:single-stranded-DNA-specific exonuclease